MAKAPHIFVFISDALLAGCQTEQVLASGASAGALRQQLNVVTQGLQAMQQYERALQDHRDFDRFVGEADQMLKDNGVAGE